MNTGSLTHKLDNLFDALAESVVEMSDEQLIEECLADGVDIEAEGAKVKDILRDTLRRFNERTAEARAPRHSPGRSGLRCSALLGDPL